MGDMSIVTIDKNGATSLNKTIDNSIILYAKTVDVEYSNDGPIKLNIPDIKKLIRALDCLQTPSPTIDLILNRNSIEYKSSSTKFKFHLIEDGIIVPPNINIQKIESFEYDTTFDLSVHSFNSILKSSTFLTDSNKIYISTENGAVYAELTDKSKSNTDSYKSAISTGYEGSEIQKEIPFSFDLFRSCSLLKTESIKVSINTARSIIAFDISDGNYKLKYISTGLVC
jgi:hypothetical protein